MKRYSPLLLVLCAVIFCHPVERVAASSSKKNLVFVIIDDLRYEKEIDTPNLDSFAQNGVSFTNIHANVALCGPSRASMFTGRTPESLCYYHHKLEDRRGDDIDDEVIERGICGTIPGYLKKHGYNIFGAGKVFHNNKDNNKIFGNSNFLRTNSEQCNGRRLFCTVAESDAEDTRALEFGKEKMKDSVEANKPFAFFYGMRKPHMPFRVPSRFWDKVGGWTPEPYEGMPALTNNYRKDPYSISHYFCKALFNYADIENAGVSTQLNSEPFPEELALQIRKGYFAASMWADDLVGQLMEFLENKALLTNTVVVITSDNGMHLGEHGGWCKQTNFDVATKVPLFIHDPEMPEHKNKIVDEIFSLVDLFPSVSSLLGLEPETCWEGESVLPSIMNANTDSPDDDFIFTLVARCVENADSQFERRLAQCRDVDELNYIGYSVRSNRWRYTEWRRVNGGTCKTAVDWNTEPFEAELYDHFEPSKFVPEHSELENLIDIDDLFLEQVRGVLRKALMIHYGACTLDCDLNQLKIPDADDMTYLPGPTTSPIITPSIAQPSSDISHVPSVFPIERVPTISPTMFPISTFSPSNSFDSSNDTFSPAVYVPSLTPVMNPGFNQSSSPSIDPGEVPSKTPTIDGKDTENLISINSTLTADDGVTVGVITGITISAVVLILLLGYLATRSVEEMPIQQWVPLDV